MILAQKIELLGCLGEKLKVTDVTSLIESAHQKNPWFTKDNIDSALSAIIHSYLDVTVLNKWTKQYSIKDLTEPKKIGLVLAGNIPFVGFHDLLSVFISNHIALIKYSDKDDILIPFILDLMVELDPDAGKYFQRVEKLTDYDAVIATGSNNTAKHFLYYFKHVPYIIRKNRNGVAILTGNETKEELRALGNDIFLYFGLGCRNVSKIYIPEGYNFEPLFTSFDDWKHLVNHHKYKNNLEYNHALFLLNKQHFLQHDVMLLLESKDIASRVGCLHFEYFSDQNSLHQTLMERQDEIQCIVTHPGFQINIPSFPFGEAQNPNIDTYADGVDTIQFLLNIHDPDHIEN